MMSYFTVLMLARVSSFALGIVTVFTAWQVLQLRKRRTLPNSPKCPGRLDPACTCDGSCQRAGSVAAIACGCGACASSLGAPFSPLSALAAAPAPRGSGAGMTGFAERGRQEFDFVAGSVSGLRQWTLEGPDFSLDPHGADLNWPLAPLTGATGFAWPPGVLEAACNNGRPHPPPVEVDSDGSRCGCGFWAYWDMSGLAGNRLASGRGLPVLGVVQGFGRVLLGERGFRSQKARIIALAPAFTIQAELALQSRMGWDEPHSPVDYFESGGTAGLLTPERLAEQEAIQREAQQHSDAWMAVIQDRLGQMYPSAKVFATAGGLLASVKTEGKPE
jgi:hypothetical protein